MLKALMPVAVFCTGCTFGIESFSVGALANMVSLIPSSVQVKTGLQRETVCTWRGSRCNGISKATIPLRQAEASIRFGQRSCTRIASRYMRAVAVQVVVTVGVAIASYGEINFVVIGVILQLISVATESTRLTLVQILLQVSFPTARPCQRAPLASDF